MKPTSPQTSADTCVPPEPDSGSPQSAPDASSTESVDPALLEAARALLSTEGALSMERLSQTTGISRSKLYRLVGSRQALLEALQASSHPELKLDMQSRILDAFRDALLQHGWEGASMDCIAGIAGVGVATLYRHFRDRETLILAFLRRFRPLENGWLLEKTQGLPFTERLLVLIQHLHERFARNSRLLLIMLAARSRHEELDRLIGRSGPRTRDQVYRLLQEGMDEGVLAPQDPHLLAPLLLGLILSTAVIQPHFLNEPTSESSQDAARRILALFLHGAQVQASPDRLAQVSTPLVDPESESGDFVQLSPQRTRGTSE